MQTIPPALTWVPIGPYQSKEILRLVRAIEENDGTPYRTSHQEILDTWGSRVVMQWRVPRALSDDMGNQMYTVKLPNQQATEEFIHFVQDR